MPRPRSVALKLSDILNAEVDRIGALAKERQLTDAELERIERIVKVNKVLVVPLSAEEKADIGGTADELVDSLTPKKDSAMFPRKGPKSTTGIYDPPEPPKAT